MLVDHELLEREFLSLADTEGIADIEELNKILERAVNLRNFLKGPERIRKVAEFVAGHYQANVEPRGYKAFLVNMTNDEKCGPGTIADAIKSNEVDVDNLADSLGIEDREACALYKHALDQFLPPEWSAVVYTGNNNDSPLLKEFHLDGKAERSIRKAFGKLDKLPKILIVTEKLLTGFDAPVLYAMYLDKPMRDHTLLQAISRVNRPYENEQEEMVKPHGFVLDFVGIFDKLEKALAFDSEEIDAVIKDLNLLKTLFKSKMEGKAPEYLGLIRHGFIDKDVDNLIEHFRDKGVRKEFFKEYKELEMLYEIISPDAYLRPFIEDYATLSSIYAVVRNAYTKRVYVDRAFQKKTNELVQQHIDTTGVQEPQAKYLLIDEETIETIRSSEDGDATKVINLVKSIHKTAEKDSDDPFLIALSDRAQSVQESFEDRQTTTADALEELLAEVQANEDRKRRQAERGMDDLTYFVLSQFEEAGIEDPEATSRKVASAFSEHPNWRKSENQQRELRQAITLTLYAVAEEPDEDEIAARVEGLLNILWRQAAS